jgi:hypothetical protein
MPLLAKRVDDLKRLTFRHDGIVFDDVDFRGWPPTEVIALLDYNIPRSLGARFHDVRLDAFFPIIMTSNVYPIFPAGDNAEQDTAIERRHRAVHVTKPLQRDGPLSHSALYARYQRAQE